jgi:hypothetical protein
MGTAVVVGMSTTTLLGVFLVPVLFVLVERIGKKKLEPQAAHVASAEGAAD